MRACGRFFCPDLMQCLILKLALLPSVYEEEATRINDKDISEDYLIFISNPNYLRYLCFEVSC